MEDLPLPRIPIRVFSSGDNFTTVPPSEPAPSNAIWRIWLWVRASFSLPAGRDAENPAAQSGRLQNCNPPASDSWRLSGTNVIQRFGIAASLDFGRIALTEHVLNFDPQVVGHHLLKSRHAPADKVIIKKLPDPAWAQPAP